MLSGPGCRSCVQPQDARRGLATGHAQGVRIYYEVSTFRDRYLTAALSCRQDVGRLCCLLNAKCVRVTGGRRGRQLTSLDAPALAIYECLITIDYEHSFLRGRQRTLPSIAVSAIKYLSVVIAVLQMVQIHADVSDMAFE